MTRTAALTLWLGAATLTGCASERPLMETPPAAAASTQPVSSEQMVDPQWWLSQPGVGTASADDFERLWATAERVSRDYLFEIDRRDRRGGLLTTQPTVSAQWFEPWRRELQSGADVADSSLATHRRTIYYAFDKGESGQFTVTPKVLVERQALAERRVTGMLGKSYFRRGAADEISGTRESDQGILLPANYWYPIGRDYAFEQTLVEELNAQLR